MDELDDINRRLRVCKLEAKRELLEIERTSLLREMTSSYTPQDRRDEALKRRAELSHECAEITNQLKTLDHHHV